jgi:hypothetical protein
MNSIDQSVVQPTLSQATTTMTLTSVEMVQIAVGDDGIICPQHNYMNNNKDYYEDRNKNGNN